MIWRTLQFLGYSNTLVALSALGLAIVSMREAQQKVQLPLLIFIFLGTQAAYYWIRRPALKQPESPEDALVVHRQRKIYPWLKWYTPIIGLSGSVYALFYLPPLALWTFLSALLLSLSYSFSSFFNPEKPKGLRWIPGLKLVVIATTWTLITHWLPLFALGQQPDWPGSVFRMALVAALALLFDIRDVDKDQNQVQTLPVRYGASAARAVGYGLVGLAFLALLYQTWAQGIWSWWQFVGMWLVLEAVSIFFYFSSEKQPDHYYVVGVEALPIFLALAVLFLP
jgi:4-hydroxybenzoate polyprenyltransferase